MSAQQNSTYILIKNNYEDSSTTGNAYYVHSANAKYHITS